MKKVLLSADGAIRLYSVPDDVADHLEKYCLEFSCHWLHKSPDAAKYRVPMGVVIGVSYTEKDFIAYLNQYVCAEPSVLLATLTDGFCEEALPAEYLGLPHFNF